MSDGLEFLFEALAQLEHDGRLRGPSSTQPEHARALDLASNDYLGFAALPFASHGRSGAGASGLVTGYHPEHLAAEAALCEWLGVEAALLFSSGYAANVGVVSALAGAGDLVVSDALNHASIIDGCRLSRAEVAVVPHLDVGAVAAALRRPGRRRFVVVESLFSMDGDGSALRALRAECDAAGAALIVDEAHALGVLGPEGRGRCAEVGVVPDVLVGPLGKAFGLGGAFVAGSGLLRSWLWNRARSFVFSTGIAPGIAAAVPGRVRRVREADALRSRVHAVAKHFREALGLGAAPIPGSPIVPWVVGDERAALALSRALLARGLLTVAIRPPTVPAGTSRLRLVARASLSEAELSHACGVLAEVAAVGAPR